MGQIFKHRACKSGRNTRMYHVTQVKTTMCKFKCLAETQTEQKKSTNTRGIMNSAFPSLHVQYEWNIMLYLSLDIHHR